MAGIVPSNENDVMNPVRETSRNIAEAQGADNPIIRELDPLLRVGLTPGHFVRDLQKELDKAIRKGFKFICVHVRDKNKHKPGTYRDPMDQTPPFFFYCSAITAEDRRRGIVGVLSNLRDDLTADVEDLSNTEDKYLEEEMDFLKYFGSSAMVMDLHPSVIPQLAGLVLGFMNKQRRNDGTVPFCWIRVNLGVNAVKGPNESWRMWNKFRILCDKHVNVFPVLQLTKDIPTEEELQLWFREKVTVIFISTDVFTTNEGGHPILPPTHAIILERFFKSGVTDVTINSVPGSKIPPVNHKEYVKAAWAIFNRNAISSSDPSPGPASAVS